METVKSYYAQLLGLDSSWAVSEVNLDLTGKSVTIFLEYRGSGGVCPDCGVRTVTVPWAEKHSRFTLLFEAFAIDVLVCAGNVKAAAILLRLTWDSAQSIIERAVARGLVRRRLTGLRYVGLDEKSFGVCARSTAC